MTGRPAITRTDHERPAVEGSRGQSREASAVEALTNTGVGFLLAIWVQRLLFPALGHDLALAENALVAAVFTILSLIRSYVLRRLFNALGGPRP